MAAGALSLATLLLVVTAPPPGTAWADVPSPPVPRVQQGGLPIIIPPPGGGSPSGSGTGTSVSPSPSTADTNSWRIADTGGIPARVRSAPSLTSTIVLRLEPGTVVSPMNEVATADGYQWRRISFDGTTGWIATSLLLEPAVPSQPARDAVYMVAAVGERGLNVRETPSTTAAVIGSLKEGAVVGLVAGPRESEGRQWLQVRTDAVTGWVIAEAIAQQ